MTFLMSSRSWAKGIFFLIIPLIIYVEFVSYYLLQFQWIRPPICDAPSCSKLLLVADPQILGSQQEFGPSMLNFVQRWDSDRYVRKTFQQALSYFEPDFIIFLGDIMDAGHVASDDEFYYDLERLWQIFKLPEWMKNTKVIMIPGDNDIGGDDDIMIPQIVNRFYKVFNQSEGPILADNLQFYKVNSLTYVFQKPEYIGIDDGIIRIALSHIPLLPRVSPFIDTVIKKIRPHLIFSGHVHKSFHTAASEDNIWQRGFASIGPNETESKVFNLRSGLVHEILVPTCSYRMGVNEMGYGAAFIDAENRLLYYHVLWLPTRFGHLYSYIAASLLFVVLIIFGIFIFITYRVRRLLRCIYSKTVAYKFYNLP